MIDLHYWPTPNGWKISIMLEECGLPYTVKPVNIGRGEQFAPEFLKPSLNNRMTAIVDHDPPGGGGPQASDYAYLQFAVAVFRKVATVGALDQAVVSEGYGTDVTLARPGVVPGELP